LLYHLRHARLRGASPRQPRHIIAFVDDGVTLHVVRVLHEAMDIGAHLQDET